MNLRMTPLAVAVFLAGAAAHAADPNLGTWKLNEGRSKFPAGQWKWTTAVYEQVEDKIKVSLDGVDNDGKPIHQEWFGRFDGKDYPVTDAGGDLDARSVKKVDSHHYTLVNKKDGKAIGTVKYVLSKDFKTRTVTYEGHNSDGKAVTRTYVYEKQ
jgi:hypothetical protein